MPSINIVANLNGGGLERDALILAELLDRADYDVCINNRTFATWGLPVRGFVSRVTQYVRKTVRHGVAARPIHDANLFLQTIEEVWLPTARKNLWIPNPDFTRPRDLTYVDGIHAIFCKTQHALSLFDEVGPDCRYIGFTSVDRRLPDTEGGAHRRGRALHLASGWLKGTEAVLSVWQRHPEWPELTVVRRSGDVSPSPAGNIHYLGRMADDALQRLQNDHRIHVCPSETEGFGHCLVEAMSCGAAVVTTDGPPMNELVATDRGVLVPYDGTGRHCLATTYHVDETALERSIQRLLLEDSGRVDRLGGNARRWFEENDRAFQDRFPRILEESL